MDLSEGMIDLPAVLKKLRQHNYLGNLLIEYQGEEDSCMALKRNVDEAQTLLEEAGLAY